MIRTCAGALLALAACTHAVSRDQFYPFGNGDLTLPKGADVPSPEIALKVPIVFYGESYDSIFVNNYGVLSFRANIPSFLNSEFPLPYPSIAAFYSNIDTSLSGAVYYKETDDARVLLKAEDSVQSNFHDYYDFRPQSVFITTWVDVTYSSQNPNNPKNTFQIAVISNGTESFVEFLYPENEIQWIQKEALPNHQPDAKAQAGFVAEDGRMYTLRGSGSHQVRNIMTWSNVHEPGKYVFRIGDIPQDGNIVVPDNYNQYELEEEEEYKTCAQSGPSVCHTQARCVDYQEGICCQCNEGFYGNGKTCIKIDVPIRAHGKLNGKINNVHLDNIDIQAYVVVSEGRSYTALSQTPPNIGGSLQQLNILGSVVGWLFAKPIGDAKNGYQLSGAVLNHTAEISFPATGDKLKVTQEYLGLDVFDQITLESDIRGTIPYILPTDKLEISEYDEQFTLVVSGLLKSESTRYFTNKRTGEVYEQVISQTYAYNTCKYAPVSEEAEEPLTVKSVKNYLGYEARDNIVRYGMTNKIMPLGQEDPCIRGRNTCGAHSTCVVQGDTFKCLCESGYINDGRNNCIDVDECAIGTHNCDLNAECYNHEGGFACRCKPGFEGDGVRCRVASICYEPCDPNAKCIESYCICNAGYTGDGKTCTSLEDIATTTCDYLNNCHPYADCVLSPSNVYECRCKQGYRGDGYACSPVRDEVQRTTEAQTSPSIEAENNDSIVLPHCDIYDMCECPLGYTSFVDDRGNHLCQLSSSNLSSELKCSQDSDCPQHAVCSFMSECVCLDGYEIVGYECVELSVPECNCTPHAHCTTDVNGEHICACDSGYHGDAAGECIYNFSCYNNSDCEINAECRQDPVSNENACVCVEGYTKDMNDACIPDKTLCNGAICAEFASCLYDKSLQVNYCECDPGFQGEGNVKCVPRGQSCDVTHDCHPDAVCTNNEYTFMCVCKEGFIGDGHSCTPEPTCRNNPYMCDTHASCLKRRDGYVCECNVGYFGNGTSCAINPRQSGNFLIASDGMFIYRVPFQVTPHDYATPINSVVDQTAVAVNVDCQTGHVYWSDVARNVIKRAAFDGSGLEVFLEKNLTSPEGIAIDWAARNIFWTDTFKFSIGVANMDTRLRKVLFKHDGNSNPRGIAVHPQRGKIFWSDWNRLAPKIEWANMDGSERGLFLGAPDVKLPNSLAIDWATDRLCYTDAGKNSIECVNIDTRQKETITTECPYPFGLAIHNGTFYWTDWKTSKVEFVEHASGRKGHVPISTASRKLFGLAVAPEQCEAYTNVCQYHNGNCGYDELCLPDGRGGRTCSPGF